MSGTHPTGTALAAAAVIDAIADIETLRCATEKEAGFTLSRSAALHRLQELLAHEAEALRLRGPASVHLENVDAVKSEIARVKVLSPITNQGPTARNTYPGQRKDWWRDAPHAPARNKGRRTMGRSGGR